MPFVKPSKELLAQCKRLPKVELHAHLSGSIPDSVLAEFLEEDLRTGRVSGSADDLVLLTSDNERSLAHCFRIFPLIHKLVHTSARLRTATEAVLRTFENENCIYLELRTTPRECGHLSASDYLSVILDTIEKWRGPLITRLILSVNRAEPVEDAHRMVSLARDVLSSHPRGDLVVGVELSGNPVRGTFGEFASLFDNVRKDFGDRLPISLHFAEVLNDVEAREMLDFKPARLGHAICMSKETEEHLLRSGICVEVCLTSNLATTSVTTLNEHPVVTLLEPSKHPYCVATDDCGVFRTSLHEEYALLKSILPHVCLENVTARAITYSFAPEALKAQLRTMVATFYRDPFSGV